uniref:Cyclic nucleotide-binding domain-containing protein n=1 Tax=Phytophthora ramorum TaxID=164328 RepID=H3H0Q3_PHYRM
MSAQDVVSSPIEEEAQAVETGGSHEQEEVEEEHGDEPEKTASGSARPFSRLVTTSAVAAALAEVQGTEAQVGAERPKKRRIDRRHSGGLEPLGEAEKQAPDTVHGHRVSAPLVEPVPERPTQVVIKPMRLGSASPRGQLKRATSTHLAGIRERLKAAGQAATPTATATVKRTPSASTTLIFKRTPSSNTTPTFRAVAKTVAANSTLASGGNAAATSSVRSEQGQNYEQMMARFQLRRLEPVGSQRSVGSEANAPNRRSSAYMPAVDSDTSHQRMDDLMNSRPRSEGEPMDNTIGREGDGDMMATSQSRVDSRADESPRRPGAPSFHSNHASIAPPATATVTPVGHLGAVSAFCIHTLGFPYEEAFHSGGRAWFIHLDALTEIVFIADFLLAFNTSFVNKRGVLVVSRRHIAWNFLTGAAMQMLQGQSLTTHSARENVFASCVNLLGSIVLAVIFGHVAMLVANFNANSTAYQRKMESIFAGMTKMQLPAPLRERIHQYYAHLWREYEALDGAPLERFAKELSHNLTLEVVLFKYMELAMHVPFWENCSPDFQKTLVLSLGTRVYLPDDFIVRRGEVGDEFYMINRGMCELVGNNDTQEHATEPLARRRSQLSEHSEHPADTSTLYTTSHDGTVYPDRDDLGSSQNRGKRTSARYAYVSPDSLPQVNGIVKTLTRGQAFGEMALLMNYQRTANVRAMTYVEMCVLSRTAFQAVLTRYPVDRKHVISQILMSSLENNERFGIPCPLTAMVRSVFADEVDSVANGEKLISPRRAAKLVAWAVNPDVEDDSIKFALSSKLKEQLVVVRDQEIGSPAHTDEDSARQAATASDPWPAGSTTSPPSPRTSSGVVNGKRGRGEDEQKECNCACGDGSTANSVSHHLTPKAPSSTPEPEEDSQVMKLESAQAQALALVQELHRGVQDTLYPQPPQSSSIDAGSAVGQNSSAITAAATNPARRRKSITRGTSTKTVTPQQRRSTFISRRSTSAPNFADLDLTAGRSADVNLDESTEQGEPSPKLRGEPAATPRKPIQRAVTARWLKTSESTRPLRNPTTLAPLVRPRRAGSSSQRFIQRVTNQLASLTTSNSTVSASPTRYADQLFGTGQPSLHADAAPSVNEMSFREDSNVSEARY